jgi:hypothetical protein
LECLTNLEDIGFSSCNNLTEAVITHFPLGIKSLHLFRCEQIKNISLEQFTDLEELELSESTNLNDADIAKLPKSIKELDLSSCKKLENASFERFEKLLSCQIFLVRRPWVAF